MKTKQRSIRVFELFCEDEQELCAYLEKNHELLKAYLLVLSGSALEEAAKVVEKFGLCYIFSMPCIEAQAVARTAPALLPQSEPIAQAVPTVQKSEVAVQPQNNRMMLDRPVRSGETIRHDGDLVLFGRVNSGAKVICGANVEAFDVIDGDVECGGDYMILKSIGKGSVVFRGEKVQPQQLSGVLVRLSFKNGLVIKEL